MKIYLLMEHVVNMDMQNDVIIAAFTTLEAAKEKLVPNTQMYIVETTLEGEMHVLTSYYFLENATFLLGITNDMDEVKRRLEEEVPEGESSLDYADNYTTFKI